MYKKHFSEWGIDNKYLNEQQVLAILRSFQNRDGTIRRASVSDADKLSKVIRYIERKPSVLRRFRSTTPPSPASSGTDSSIVEFTPSPSPSFSTISIDEQILITMERYIDSSLQDGRWRRDARGEWQAVTDGGCERLQCFWNTFALGSDCMSKSEGGPAPFLPILDAAYNDIKAILRDEHPFFIFYISSLVAHLVATERHELLISLLRHLRDMSDILFQAEEHPVRHFIRFIGDGTGSIDFLSVDRLLRASIMNFEWLLGPADTLNAHVFVEYMTFTRRLPGLDIGTQFISSWKLRHSPGDLSDDTLQFAFVEEAAFSLRRHLDAGDVSEAQRTLADYRQVLDRNEDKDWFINQRAKYHLLAARLSLIKNDPDAADAHCTSAVFFAKDGGDENTVVAIMSKVEELKKEIGRLPDAERLKEERLHRTLAMVSSSEEHDQLYVGDDGQH